MHVLFDSRRVFSVSTSPRSPGVSLTAAVVAFLALVCPLTFASSTVDLREDPLAPAAEFTKDHDRDLTQARKDLLEARNRVLKEKLSDSQMSAVFDSITALEKTIQTLEKMKAAWDAYSAITDDQIDVPHYLILFDAFRNLEIRVESGTNAPSPEAWENLFFRLAPYARQELLPIPEVAPLAMRARMLAAKCCLNVSVTYHARKYKREFFFPPYLKGIAILDNLARVGYRPVGDQLWSVPPDRLGDVDRDHGREAALLLNDYCPWGVRLFSMLLEAGYADGIDLAILRPYGGSEKIWERALGDNVPEKIRQDLAAVCSGTFKYLGQNASIDWVKTPKPTYTVWFYSPTAYDVAASTLTKWALRAIKLLKSGPLDLAVDEIIGVLVSFIGEIVGPNDEIYGGCVFVSDLNNYGVIDSDFLIDAKPSIHFKSLKTSLVKAMEYFERKEVEFLFESIDPSNQDVFKQTGNARSYDGKSPFPQIMIRADVMGFENVEDVRYRHMWHCVFYYQLDPRALIGESGVYDLSKIAVGSPSPVGSAGQAAGVRDDSCWTMLPTKPSPLGSRLYLIDFTPKGQIVRIVVTKRLLEKWKSLLPDGYDVEIALREPPHWSFSTDGGRLMADKRDGKYVSEGKAVEGEFVSKVINRDHWSEDGYRSLVILSPPAVLRPTTSVFNEYGLEVSGRRSPGASASDDAAAPQRVPSPEIIPVAKCEVLLHSKKGRPMKGQLSSPYKGVVELVMNLDEPFDIEPKGGTEPLLPTRLSVDKLNAETGQIDSPFFLDPGEFRLRVVASPVEPGMHRLTAAINGWRQVNLWQDTDRISGGVVFEAPIPLDVGENTVTLRFGELKPLTFKVTRPQPRAFDLAKAKLELQSDHEWAQKAKHEGNAEEYYSRLQAVVSDLQTIGAGLVESGRYEEAGSTLDDALMRIPGQEELTANNCAGMADNYARMKMDINEIRTTVGLFIGNREIFFTSGTAWLSALKARRLADSGTLDEDDWEDLADEYEWLALRYILLGGGRQDVEALIRRYSECMKNAGAFDPSWVEFRFKYPKEDTK